MRVDIEPAVGALGVSPALREMHVTAHEFHATAVAGGSVLPLAVVVQSREQVIGCHSFERFVSPSWETLYVFQEQYAAAWKIGDVMRSRPTRGAHLLTLSVPTGEWIARAVALRALRERGREPPLLLSLMCDMQALPVWHTLHVPFHAMVERWTRDFELETQRRRVGRTGVAKALSRKDYTLSNSNIRACQGVFDASGAHGMQRELLAMNTPILETLPNAQSLESARFHSIDIGDWVRWTHHGKDMRGPMKDEPFSKPWLSDVSVWTEDHAIMYNTTLLGRFVDRWRLAVGTTSAGVKLIPQLCCAERLATVRHNDLPLFFDRAWPTLHAVGGPGGKRTQLFDASKYAGVDMGFLRAYNFQLLSEVASPFGCMREALAMLKHTGHAVDIACLIPMRHWHDSHLPRDLTPAAMSTVALQLLKVLGYSLLAEDADAMWLWSPFWHGYRVQWADAHSLKTDKACGEVAMAAPAPLPGKAGLCAKDEQKASNSRLAALAAARLEGGAAATHGGDASWLQPEESELVRLDKNTSLVDLNYPAFGWSNRELPGGTARVMGALICDALQSLRARQQQRAGGVSTQPAQQVLRTGNGPVVRDGDWLTMLADMQPYC